MVEEIRLRAVRDEDLDVLFGHQADEVASQMAAFPSRDRGAFDAHWARIRADDSNLLRVIEVDGAVAGYIGSWSQDGQRLLGYWVGREHWGRGVATRAMLQFVAVERHRPLHAHVVEHNVGSIRVLEKGGFRRDLEAEARASPPVDGIEEFIYVRDAR